MKLDKSEEKYIESVEALKRLWDNSMDTIMALQHTTGKTRIRFISIFMGKIRKLQFELEEECYQKYKTKENF